MPPTYVGAMLVRRGNTNRPLADLTNDDVLNVHDFGALGDGSTNDTAAIQACFDKAWGGGVSTLPHNNAVGQSGFRAVYFPAGKYMTNDSLKAYDIVGGMIFGDGKRASQIVCTGASKDVIYANPFTLFTIREISLKNSGTTPGTCLNVSKRADFATSIYTSSNGVKLINCAFDGGLDTVRLGEYSTGYPTGTGNEQTSEWLFINCDISGASRFGVNFIQLNVLNIGFIGCNIFNNGSLGIQGNSGHASYIYGCMFSNNGSKSADLTIGSPHNVIGCWSSDPQFTASGIGDGTATGVHTPLLLAGCYHDAATNGPLGVSAGRIAMDCCWTTKGHLAATGTIGTFTNLYMRASRFGRSDYLTFQPYPNMPTSIKEDLGNRQP